MTDMRERKRLLERPKTRPPEVVPPKAKPFKPAPPRLFRWIEWMAVVVAAAALIVGAIWLAGRGGDEEVVAFHAEHGPFTDMAARDLAAVDLDSRLAGLDANLDRDVVGWADFTPLAVRDLSGVNLGTRMAGLDANLDPDLSVIPAYAADIGGYYDPYESQWVSLLPVNPTAYFNPASPNWIPELGGYFDAATSTWVPRQWFADEALEFGGYYDPYRSQWVDYPKVSPIASAGPSAVVFQQPALAVAHGYWNSYLNEWVEFGAPAEGYWNSYTNEWVEFEQDLWGKEFLEWRFEGKV